MKKLISIFAILVTALAAGTAHAVVIFDNLTGAIVANSKEVSDFQWLSLPISVGTSALNVNQVEVLVSASSGATLTQPLVARICAEDTGANAGKPNLASCSTFTTVTDTKTLSNGTWTTVSFTGNYSAIANETVHVVLTSTQVSGNGYYVWADIFQNQSVVTSDNVGSTWSTGTDSKATLYRLSGVPPVPASLSPTTQTINATVGAAMAASTAMTASNFVGAVTYSVGPALPAGLSLNTATGVISGTPSAVQAAATYTITGTGATSGTATATVSIAVAAVGAAATSIPTLSEWGMILLSGLLALFGVRQARQPARRAR